MGKGLNVKKGDTALVISGKDKGVKGKVLGVFPAKEQIIVENVNMVAKHRKQRSQQDPGGIRHQEGPVNVSNVMLVCPSCGKPTRVGHSIDGDTKRRVCKKCGADLK